MSDTSQARVDESGGANDTVIRPADAAPGPLVGVAYSILRHDHDAGAVVIAVNRREHTVSIPRGTDSTAFYRIIAEAARGFAAKGSA